MDLLKVEPDPCNESEGTDVKIEAVTIKEEEVIIKEEEVTVTDEEVIIKEEEDPLLIRLPLTEAEHEVSCRSVCPLLCHFASTQKCLVSFFCLSVHRKQLHLGQQFFRKAPCIVCIQFQLSCV